jgi:hypothetical protein
MKTRWETRGLLVLTIIIGLLTMSTIALAREVVQKWELVNPAGKINLKLTEVNPHPTTLEGKTVLLRWNGKPNGDLFLDRVAELLTQQVRNVKVIRLYELDPSTADTERGGGLLTPTPGVIRIDQSIQGCQELARRVATYKPDLVISAQAD